MGELSEDGCPETASSTKLILPVQMIKGIDGETPKMQKMLRCTP